MAQFRSFRFSPLDIPPGYRTPSPPARTTVEPLTPFDSTLRKDGSQLDEGNRKERVLGKIAKLQARPLFRSLQHETRPYEGIQSSPQHDLHYTSAMDAFATIALSVNQLYQPARQPHQSSTWSQIQQYGKNGTYLGKAGQISDHLEERPWKRARSDLPAAVETRGKDNRSSTSHLSGGPWSSLSEYNLEDQSGGGAVLHPSNPEVTQDAELLLNFMNSSGESKRNILQPPSSAHSDTGGGTVKFSHDRALHSGLLSTPTSGLVFQEDSRKNFDLSPPYNHSRACQSSKVSDMAVGSYGLASKTGKSVKSTKKETHRNRGWPRGKPRGPRRNWASSQGGHNENIASVPSVSTAQDMDLDNRDSSGSKVAGDDIAYQHQDGIWNSTKGPTHSALSAHITEIQLQSNPDRIQRRNSISGYTIRTESRNAFGHSNSDLGRTSLRRSSSDSGFLKQASRKSGMYLNDDEANASEEKIKNRCAGCSLLQSSIGPDTEGEVLSWISCDGCKRWFHAACTGMTDNQIKTVDKYSCKNCVKTCGPTTCKLDSTVEAPMYPKFF
jgi:hypothetical protein